MRHEVEKLTTEELDYIFIETTDRGPFTEDLFYRVYAGNRKWRIPISKLSKDWILSLPNINLEKFTMAQFSTDDAWFLIWAKYPDFLISDERKTELQGRLTNFLCRHFKADENHLKVIASSVIFSYDENSRAYHSIQHIARSLRELDAVSNEKYDKASIELAIWYHDVVYSPTSLDNEKESADRMVCDLELFESDLSLTKIKKMILATTHDEMSVYDEDTKLLLDIDLSILGSCRFDYSIYTEDVRKEYKDLSAFKFYFGRKKFLTNLMKKNIFRTPSMSQKYEVSARDNIQNELKQWRYRWIPCF